MYKRIKISELLKLQSPIIIDIREPYEFQMGSIPNAINIPMNVLLDNHNKYLQLGVRYYIYCQTDRRSTKVSEYLSSKGYDVYLIEGGYQEWLLINK